jgi:nucleoside-diphosphate-sugar epimerase
MRYRAAACRDRHPGDLRQGAAARLRVDFEANLPIVRACVRHRKRIVFPSTSEVYGMCADDEFDPERSDLVLGRSTSRAGSTRREAADGPRDSRVRDAGGLDYTLFRPFNWIGAGLDSINTAKEGSSRVITQFLGRIVRGEAIKLVDGGTQKRAFTYIDDVDRRADEDHRQQGQHRGAEIYNIGNPANNFSVRELATMMLDMALTYPEYRETAMRVRIVETTAADTTATATRTFRIACQNHQHLCRSRLATSVRDGRSAQTHLRRVPRAGRMARQLVE